MSFPQRPATPVGTIHLLHVGAPDNREAALQEILGEGTETFAVQAGERADVHCTQVPCRADRLALFTFRDLARKIRQTGTRACYRPPGERCSSEWATSKMKK